MIKLIDKAYKKTNEKVFLQLFCVHIKMRNKLPKIQRKTRKQARKRY